MNDPEPQRRQAIALFRYGLIAELMHLPERSRGLYAKLREKAAVTYTIPASRRTRVAAETLRHWLKRYREGGFDALLPRPRSDRGRSRALPQALADALLTLKEEQPRLSIPMLIKTARERGVVSEGEPLPRSTVHRLFSRHGLMRVDPAEPPAERDRRRFAYERAGELWMSDVMHGPKVTLPEGTRRKTYLIAFLDDATRLIPYGAFTLAENTETFCPVFKQALLRRGVPLRLYVDNGANFRSQQLALVCAKLGVTLIHARPYQPQGKGKLERWFRTVRAQFLTRCVAADLESLEALNKKLWAWVEGEYHHTPHTSLEEQTPLECWARRAEHVRLPDPAVDLDALFLFEAQRRVQRDRTVSLNGVVYEVDAALVGEKVLLRYDPSVPASRGIEVWHRGQYTGRARVVDAYANCFVKRQRPSRTLQADTPPPAPARAGLPLRKLRRNQEP